MRFAVESWSPDYGTPVDDSLEPGASEVDGSVEVPIGRWAPLSPPATTPPLADVLFVDGVRRVDAHVWLTGDAGEVHQGICASYAAGAVRCNGSAHLDELRIERSLFCPARSMAPLRTRHGTFVPRVTASDDGVDLSLALQRAMGDLEQRVAAVAEPTDIVVVDGPLRPGQDRVAATDIVGYVKTHRSAYGPDEVRQVIAQLAVGERTPLLLIAGIRSRYTWYQRLPGPHRHAWAGVVRAEVPDGMGRARAVSLADRLAAGLGRFASVEQKDPRAPQNLYPIGALERELRWRLGDAALLMRALREAAAGGRRIAS